MSCVGVMFAPHHQPAADEVVRVCRPGGCIGVLSWTPEGFIGQLFATMKPYVPPAPAGVQPPPLWGDETHVRGLFGDRVQDLTTTREQLAVTRFVRPDDFRTFFKQCYGPTIAAYRGIAQDPVKVAALDDALSELTARFSTPDGRMEWEYLLVTGTRR